MSDTAPHALPRKAIRWAVAAVGLYTALLLSCDVGTSAGDRIDNPTPPRSSGAQTFLGVRDTTWFPVMYGVSGVVLGAILWWLARRWRATGLAHPAARVLLAFVLLSLADPLISWASYTAYNPELIHFPVDWAWWDIAPVVQSPGSRVRTRCSTWCRRSPASGSGAPRHPPAHRGAVDRPAGRHRGRHPAAGRPGRVPAAQRAEPAAGGQAAG